MSMKRVLAVLCALLFAAVTMGQEGCETETTDQPDEGGEEQRAALGDAITLEGNEEGLKVKVTPTRVIDPLSAGEFDQPQGNRRFVGVRMTLENTGDATYDDAPSNGAQLILSNDEQADTTILTGGPCSGDFGSDLRLGPGDRRRGCIPFEVPRRQDVRSFQFTLESGFGPATGVWQVR